jgi:Ni/Co efflux regulator RcnB
MRALLATLVIAATPALALAQASPPAKPDATAAAKPAPKPLHKKRKLAHSAQKAVEEATPVDDDPAVTLTPADLEVAKHVFTGDIPCELGATVHITPHKRDGFFVVRAGIQRFRMHPVESRTGAIRLEDPRAGAMWLQLGNKSMLMSQKMGLRLADECMSPAQAAVNEALKKHPLPSLLEPLPAASGAAAATQAPAATAAIPAPAMSK